MEKMSNVKNVKQEMSNGNVKWKSENVKWEISNWNVIWECQMRNFKREKCLMGFFPTLFHELIFAMYLSTLQFSHFKKNQGP